MVQETAENGRLSQWEQMQARVCEYKRPFETSEEGVRKMAFRMMYFAQAILPQDIHGEESSRKTVSEIRTALVNGQLQSGVELAQRAHDQWAARELLNKNREVPEIMLDFLIPFVATVNSMSGDERLPTIKRSLKAFQNERGSLFLLYLAERRLMQRQAWEEQLNKVEAKLKDPASIMSIGKGRRLLRDQARLAQLIQTS